MATIDYWNSFRSVYSAQGYLVVVTRDSLTPGDMIVKPNWIGSKDMPEQITQLPFRVIEPTSFVEFVLQAVRIFGHVPHFTNEDQFYRCVVAD